VDLAPMALVCAFWFWLGGVYIWGAPFGSRRYFRQSGLRRPLNFNWSAAGLRISGEAMFQEHAWRDVLRWKEDRAAIVVVMTERSFIPIPKRLFSEPDLAELRAFLAPIRRA